MTKRFITAISTRLPRALAGHQACSGARTPRFRSLRTAGPARDRWAREKSPVPVEVVAPGVAWREDDVAEAAACHSPEDEAPDAMLLPEHSSGD